jgi:ubiquinone/menaquinone biosynthesis C-methylase UbiE
MVRAADEVLRSEFQSGLEDFETIEFSDANKQTNNKSGRKKKVHKVHILDPATGTGAFLAEIVKQVQAKVPAGIWPDCVQKHLIPRL